MFSFTTKLTKKKLIIMSLITGAILLVLILLISMRNAGALVQGYKGADTEQGRLDFIRSYGWEVDETSAEEKEVIIPSVFDSVYTRYNDLQRGQRLDLRDVAGRVVSHFSYIVTNYPTGEQNVRINLLVYKGRVIGGDVMSPRLDGFMHGFDMPSE